MTNSRTLPVVRIGMLRLTDAAPVVVALEKGFFAANGLDVRLAVEPSWANVADKLAFHHLDAAVMLPPLALAMALGLRGSAVDITIPMGISLNGNSVTVRREIAEAVASPGDSGAVATGRRFGLWLKAQTRKPRLAVVHTFSTHNLLLRYWLAVSGVDPARDVEITILPPAETADALRAGEIDGFCAGAPWGSVAATEGVGRTVVVSSEIWRDHPEKCLAVGDFAIQQPQSLNRLLTALVQAALYCDKPENASEVAGIVGGSNYVNVDASLIRASLPVESPLMPRGDVDRSVFAAHGACIPSREHAMWFLSQMARWGYVEHSVDASRIAGKVYRPELVSALPGVWSERGSEQFCDGAAFNAAHIHVANPTDSSE